MKKILLTGGKGFFSTRFFKRYKDEFEVVLMSRQELDVSNKEEVLNKLNEIKPDYVIHAAAIAVTDFCNENPEIAYKINVEGAINVGQACKKINAKMIFISTEQIFNGNKELGPYSEEHIAVPNTVYGQNKLEAEGLLKDLLDELWIIRFTWLFGLPEKECNMATNIIWESITKLLKGEKIKASSYEFRGMTYDTEMIENVIKIFSLPYGTYNLGSENDLSRYEIVKHILCEMGLENRIDEVLIKDNEKYNENCKRDVRLNTNKAKECGLVFSSSKDAISKCIKDYKMKL
ncbi:SDR family oxidoreductase [Clostridium uliginosum]|uniref:dTDP-4-dehydrorhamnose reductase n=1 Tax=Clostridium uliginosum TaxID=119641 RepID=A0A1I1HAT5_9CLOT|nr:sugar nucleotide-binding protein [Clostridium uliginosum]SFC20876.1 dTDP-4-dehydrorhamnose reductase [Clostridium uliginosum]